MKIAFLMRYDYEEKRGGDVIQVESYSRELIKSGHECVLLSNLDQHQCDYFDIFFLVNIDRPIETIKYWKLLKARAIGKKIFVIPIHHPIAAINKFEQFKRGLFYSFFNFLFPDFYVREKIKNLIRFSRQYSMLIESLRQLFTNYRATIKEIIRDSDGVVYISIGERDSVYADFSVESKKSVIAYNAVEFDAHNFSTSIKEYDVVVVGRIEPRKNQLSIIAALDGLNYRVKFIGSINKNSRKYANQFYAAITDSENLEYLGPKSYAETLLQISKARLLINSSYFEVNPLVDLEAALVGTQVATTMYSYTKESLPNVVLIDPWNVNDIRDKIKYVLDQNVNTINHSNIQSSWRDSVNKIVELF